MRQLTSRVTDAFLRWTEPGVLLAALLYMVPLGFGGTLLIGASTFDTSTAYDSMELLASERTWGEVSVSSSFVCALLWFQGHYLCRLFSFAVMLVWHGLVAALVFHAAWLSTGTWTYSSLAATATLLLIRTAIRGRND